MNTSLPTRPPVDVALLWRPGASVCHLDGGDRRPLCGARGPRTPAALGPGDRPWICTRCRQSYDEQAPTPTPTVTPERTERRGCDECSAPHAVLIRSHAATAPDGFVRLCLRHFNSWQPDPRDLGKIPEYRRTRRKRRS
jgi:hypothetical protein